MMHTQNQGSPFSFVYVRGNQRSGVRPRIVFLAWFIACLAPMLFGADYKKGSGNTAFADPAIPRPGTRPCVVELFRNMAFADFEAKPFAYVPPRCSGPWAKVVFEADFDVTAGRQYDRTVNVWIGGANIYYGTAAEPSKTVAPRWHVERDLTEYSALFSSAQPGMVDLGNLVDSTYTGVIHGSARLSFYPAQAGTKVPTTADVVLPLSAGPNGGAVNLANSGSVLAKTFSMPRNVERAYLDVYAKSQSKDEFWYTCVPDDLATDLQSCGGGSFREVEISIDGKPAGVAPIYPWIYTGGMDPYLWRPIPAVQTLNFEPYRVDLTPFAAVLSNGERHEIAISVFNANDYFAVTGSVLLYLDHASKQVTGELTANTLEPPSRPEIVRDLPRKNGVIDGTVKTASARRFRVAGYVNTSHGRVESEIVQSVEFHNYQTFLISPQQTVQTVLQSTVIESATTTNENNDRHTTHTRIHFPLFVDVTTKINPDKSSAQKTTVRQAFTRNETRATNDFPVGLSFLSNAISSEDTVQFGADNRRTGHSGQNSSQRYIYADSDGRCYSRSLNASNGVLTGVQKGKACSAM